MLGGVGGFEMFDPSQMGPDESAPPVVLTRLELLNEPVAPGQDPRLPRSITLTDRLEIPSRAALVSFQFAALNYRTARRTRIEYRLDGFDQGWRASGPER